MMMFFSCTGTLLVLLTLSVVVPDADGKITAIPREFYPGFNRHLTVNCAFSDLKSYDITTPVALILKLKRNQSQEFEDVVVVDTEFNVNLNKKNGNPTASGEVSVSGKSFLNVSWNDPTACQAGVYKCTLIGINKNFEIKTKEETYDVPEVTSLATDARYLVKEILRLKQRLKYVQNLQEAFEKKTGRLAAAIFQADKAFNGRRYFISKKGIDNKILIAESFCQMIDGYLAEIKNAGEYKFLQKFLSDISGFEAVFIGATTLGKPTVYRNSLKPLNFSDWVPGKRDKNDGVEYCVTLRRSYKWKMFNDDCLSQDLDTRFLCEVPLS